MTAAPMPQVTVLVAWQHGPLTNPQFLNTALLGPDNVAAEKWTIMSPSGADRGLVSALPGGSRGRQHELAVFEAASLRLRLDNSDGRFNPWNTASPYYGWLKPGRLIRVLAQWNFISDQWSPYNYTQGATALAVGLTQSGIDRGLQRFAVQQGRRYSARVEATSTLQGNKVGIAFQWFNAAGSSLVGSTGTMVAVPTAGTVVVERSNIVPPAGYHSAQVLLIHETGVGSASGTTTFTNPGAWPVGTLPTYAPAVGSPVRFTGHIHAFDPEWPDRRSFYVDAEASDLLRVLNTLDLPASAYDLEIRKDGFLTSYWPLSESAGTVAADTVGNRPGVYTPQAILGGAAILPTGGSSMVLPSTQYDDYVVNLSGVPATADFEVAFAVSGITLPSSAILLAAPDGPGAFTVGYTAAGIAQLQVYTSRAGAAGLTINGGTVADGKTHRITVRRNFGTSGWTLTVDGVESSTGFLAGVTLGTGLRGGYLTSASGTGGGQMAGIALFAITLGNRLAAQQAAFVGNAWAGDTATTRAGRILDHLGLPTNLRNLDNTCVSPLAGASTLGGSALAYLQALETAEAGALYIDRTGKVTLLSRQTIFDRAYDTPAVTFGDLAGQAPHQPGPTMTFNDSEVVNQVTASRDGGLAVTVVDAASRADHGARSRDITGLLLSRDTEVLDRAHFELATYRDARFVLRNLSIWPLEATGMIEALLGLDLLQLVGVARSDIAGDPLDQPSLLERIEETFTSTDWRMSIAVSPHQAEQFWILDVSQLDVNTRLGF